MSSGLAIISKAVFEKQARGAEIGSVVPIDRYGAVPRPLDAMDGALFLVTVRPPDEELWLVAVLEAPTKKGSAWVAASNEVAIRDISSLRSKLRFENGKGLPGEEGKLAMSLQTARILTDADVALLRGGKASKASKAATPAKPATPANPAKAVTIAAPSSATTSVQGANGEAVRAAIAKKDPGAALVAALDWWRSQRAPAIADLVDVLSSKIGTGPTTDQAAWTNLARSRDPRTLGALLASLAEMPVSFLPTAADMISRFPDDPRVARTCGELAQDPITTSSSTYGFWSKLIEATIRSGDTRVIDTFASRLRKQAGPSQFWPKFYAALAKANKKLGALAVPTVAMKDVAQLTKAAAALSRSPGSISKVAVTAPASADEAPSLAHAITHLGAGKLDAAIAVMVARWREVRAPELADAIDRASRLLPSFDRPLRAAGKKEDPWHDLFDADPNAHMPQLLLNLHAGGMKLAELRLATLTTLPPDPRIAMRLAALTHGRHTGPERTQYWAASQQLLSSIADVRTIDPLVAEYGAFDGMRENHHKQARKNLKPFVTTAQRPALAKDDAAVLAKLSTALAKLEAKHTDERDLVDAIAAEPASDAPRLVYADWLQEREHPRGEWISLSLKSSSTAAETARLEELAKTPYLYGVLEDLWAYDQEPAKRGMVAELATDYRAGTVLLREAAHVPAIRALTTLEVSRQLPTDEDLALFAANAPALSRITFEATPKTPYALAGWKPGKDKRTLLRA